MENSPGILFWILSIVTVVTAVFCVTAKRALYVAIAQLIFILSLLNLLMTLGLAGIAFIYGLMSVVFVAMLTLALKKSINKDLFAFSLKTAPRQIFFFTVSILIFVGCLFLVSETEVWQYAAETRALTSFELLSSLTESFLLPFMLFKSILLILLVVVIFNLKKKTS